MTQHVPYTTRPGITLPAIRAYRLRALYRYYRACFTGPAVSATHAYALARARVALPA